MNDITSAKIPRSVVFHTCHGYQHLLTLYDNQIAVSLIHEDRIVSLLENTNTNFSRLVFLHPDDCYGLFFPEENFVTIFGKFGFLLCYQLSDGGEESAGIGMSGLQQN